MRKAKRKKFFKHSNNFFGGSIFNNFTYERNLILLILVDELILVSIWLIISCESHGFADSLVIIFDFVSFFVFAVNLVLIFTFTFIGHFVKKHCHTQTDLSIMVLVIFPFHKRVDIRIIFI